ncbi:hypothetical protein K7432_017281 [Basidiobolus ranarum]|uniref:Hydrophobin n=1 Tax=Basidiobolus ranarum TaxID=34480 RepID=A0ABR2VKK0_9FUNG
MKFFTSALLVLPAVLVMAQEPTLIDISPIVAKQADSICNGVVARLAIFGVHVDANVCLNVGIADLISSVQTPSIMTCAEAVTAISLLGTEVDINLCLDTGSHGKENADILMTRDGNMNVMHKKPAVQPPTPPTQPPAYPIQSSPPVSTRHSKSCETIIAKIHTLCGANIDVSVCLSLGINIDLLRLDRLKCRVIVDAAQIAGVSVELGVCNLFDGRINIGLDKINGL